MTDIENSVTINGIRYDAVGTMEIVGCKKCAFFTPGTERCPKAAVCCAFAGVLKYPTIYLVKSEGKCVAEMSDREIMHKMVDKICDAQSEPDTDGNVDKTRATYREVTSDGCIREIFVHAYSIKYNAKK